MEIKPFLKWAGGKRWLVGRSEFCVPEFSGRYVEPFLGGGAIFFHLRPQAALLGDANGRLVETYECIRSDWGQLTDLLSDHHNKHTKEYYYSMRDTEFKSPIERAAQFIYLNRACWNGLYRVNLSGKFNVPIGTKNWIISASDDFNTISNALQGAEICCQDFEKTVDSAEAGDFVFVDPPYTVAHNFNGFVKYNEKIFTWDDQVRLASACYRARARGAHVLITNANHPSISELYGQAAHLVSVPRRSVISGRTTGRTPTSELLITLS